MKFIKMTCVALLFGAVAFWWLTAPSSIDVDEIPSHSPNLAKGEQLFWAGGCGSCHAKEGATGDEKLELGGGLALTTPFGVFIAPNISPHRDGIGGWTDEDFINAMVKGVSPNGRHYYPAFPYTNYQIMPFTDLLDLKAFINTLPLVSGKSPEHELDFPFNIRRGLGLWKKWYLNHETFKADLNKDLHIERGRYLVDGPGHCGACHTPRDSFGGEIKERYLSGGRSFEIDSQTGEASEGFIPNLTPHDNGIGDWSVSDIAYSLETGFTPEFDSFGGSMASVQENMSKLSESDREAIGLYLKSIAAVE